MPIAPLSVFLTGVLTVAPHTKCQPGAGRLSEEAPIAACERASIDLEAEK